jgi:hypothetical protein
VWAGVLSQEMAQPFFSSSISIVRSDVKPIDSQSLGFQQRCLSLTVSQLLIEISEWSKTNPQRG